MWYSRGQGKVLTYDVPNWQRYTIIYPIQCFGRHTFPQLLSNTHPSATTFLVFPLNISTASHGLLTAAYGVWTKRLQAQWQRISSVLSLLTGLVTQSSTAVVHLWLSHTTDTENLSFSCRTQCRQHASNKNIKWNITKAYAVVVKSQRMSEACAFVLRMKIMPEEKTKMLITIFNRQ